MLNKNVPKDGDLLTSRGGSILKNVKRSARFYAVQLVGEMLRNTALRV